MFHRVLSATCKGLLDAQDPLALQRHLDCNPACPLHMAFTPAPPATLPIPTAGVCCPGVACLLQFKSTMLSCDTRGTSMPGHCQPGHYTIQLYHFKQSMHVQSFALVLDANPCYSPWSLTASWSTSTSFCSTLYLRPHVRTLAAAYHALRCFGSDALASCTAASARHLVFSTARMVAG
jgi:hypothetical protein